MNSFILVDYDDDVAAVVMGNPIDSHDDDAHSRALAAQFDLKSLALHERFAKAASDSLNPMYECMFLTSQSDLIFKVEVSVIIWIFALPYKAHSQSALAGR